MSFTPTAVFSPGLGRSRGHDPYAQLLTHAPKLREWDFSPQLLGGCRLSLVYVFPVGIKHLGHAMFLDPGPQHARSRPDGLFFPHTSHGMVSGIITMSIRQPRPCGQDTSFAVQRNSYSSTGCP